MPAALPGMPHAVNERTPGEPVLSAAEQARFSWARLIQSRDELPPAYRNFFEARPAGEAFPYVVLTPTFAGFWRRESEKLVCCLDDRLIILEKTAGELKCTAFPVSEVTYVETGSVLLKAWLKIQGRANDTSTLTAVTLRYNTVTERYFTPFVERIRGVAFRPLDGSHDDELSKLDDVPELSFKFRNYARRSVPSGDHVIAEIAQSEVHRPVIRIGHWTYQRTIIMAHVLVLTDRELILIRDDPESPEAFDSTRYGGVWDYIPLSKIERIVWQDKDADVSSVTLELPLGDRIETLFAADRHAEVERFLTELIEWVPEATLQRA
jgi:hypothetical protein